VLRFAHRTARVVTTLSERANRATEHTLLDGQRPRAIVPAIHGLLFAKPQLPVDRMAEIQAPALLLAHLHDASHPLRSCEMLHERLPNAILDVAPSQTFWRCNPEALTRIVVSFLKTGARVGSS
jgi:hypothetical protein